MRTKKKNKMRTPEEKEQIVLESYKIGRAAIIEKYEISDSTVTYWRRKYEKGGVNGLKSKTGKAKGPGKGNPYGGLQNKKSRTREEELELENLRLKVEVARLKKGYRVKGVGPKKEYVTIKGSNTRS